MGSGSLSRVPVSTEQDCGVSNMGEVVVRSGRLSEDLQIRSLVVIKMGGGTVQVL